MGCITIPTLEQPPWTTVTVAGQHFQRLPIRTPWLGEKDDLAGALLKHTESRQPGDTVVISEKVTLLLVGRAIPMESVRTRWDARLLARFVRPEPGARGLSHPEKMQYVFSAVGRPRVYAAAAAAALTRPFGIRGAFYRVAGTLARDIDGGRHPYEGLLFPPFDADVATAISKELEAKLDTGVAIVDINDAHGLIRGRSPRALPADTLVGVLADNPLGQRQRGTPFGLIRPVRAG
jgi:F420-0:gamma-glutamyl ligase